MVLTCNCTFCVSQTGMPMNQSNSYRESWEAHFGRELQAFGLVPFLAVLGGDAAVNHPGMWFTWADPFDNHQRIS